MSTTKDIPVPEDALRILHLLNKQNPALQISEEYIKRHVRFEGGQDTILPGCLKSSAIAAALHAAVGCVANQIAEYRYDCKANNVLVNTDHAAYYLGHVGLFMAGGKKLPEVMSLAPSWEGDGLSREIARQSTSIYPTKDGRDFYLHSSLDGHHLIEKIMCLDYNDERAKTRIGARKLIGDWVAKYTAIELEDMMVKNRECGSICYTPEEWQNSEMGQAIGARPLLDVRKMGQDVGAPTPLPTPFSPHTYAKGDRPLLGVKVVELVRVIAGPTVGRTLAELGATVIKINPPHLRDISLFQFTLTTGVRTAGLDIRKEADREQLDKLIGEADVFIDGYRPGSLLMKGYGEKEAIRLAKKYRGPDATIVYLHESCYGIEGPYAARPGWQQIADAASGSCVVQGKSLGSKRAILPSLPISDLSTGVIGALDILIALRERAKIGGSYACSASLVRFDMFQLTPEVGFYSQELVDRVKKEFQWPEMLGENGVLELLNIVITQWRKFRPKDMDFGTSPFFFHFSGNTPFKTAVNIKPVAQLSETPSFWKNGPRPYMYEAASFS